MSRLLIMAKAPIPGTAKTRLRLPPESAARLQAALTFDAVPKAHALGLGPACVAGTPADALELIESLLPEGVRLFAQHGGDLGERMLGAAASLFREHPEPVLILGTDAPTLPPRSIRTAARALETHDASIIASDDGSYVLLGLRGPHQALFRGIRWSTETVYHETVKAASEDGVSLHEGEPCYDVDTPEDLIRVRAELLERPEIAPRAAGVLGEL